jgi:hypothetical protein
MGGAPRGVRPHWPCCHCKPLKNVPGGTGTAGPAKKHMAMTMITVAATGRRRAGFLGAIISNCLLQPPFGRGGEW